MTLDPRIEKLNRIGIALSSETDIDRLLSLIVSEVRDFTQADAGSLYTLEDDRLIFRVAQNDTLDGKKGLPSSFKPHPIPLDTSSIAGYVASTGEVLHIEDVYLLGKDRPYSFNRSFDEENGYRSLHTAVIGPEGKILEVQIRTHQMHEEAELGVCAHWRYKGSDAAEAMASTYEEKIAWLRQVLDWHEETGDTGGVAEQFNFDVAQDRVYVFTPHGDVVNLAQGATPLDFAYHVHTEVGHRCRGAKVNGAIVPLTYGLQTGGRRSPLLGAL